MGLKQYIKNSSSSSNNFFYLSLFLITTLKFFLFHFIIYKQSILQWGSVSIIPVIQKLTDNSYLPLDNFLTGVSESPNIIFAIIVYLLSFINGDIFSTLFFLKLIYIFFIPLLVLKLCFTIIERHALYVNSQEALIDLQKIMIFFLVLILTSLSNLYAFSEKLFNNAELSLSIESFFMPFGWANILSQSFIAPSTFAFALGIIFNILFLLSKERFKKIPAIFLFFATLTHPVIGIGQFLIGSILALTFTSKKKTLLNLSKYFFISILVPIIIIINSFSPESSVDASSFIDTYIFLRHPHHYRMSFVFGWGSVFWIFIMIINILISLYIKSKQLIIYNTLVFAFIFISILAQYLGTEIYEILKIAELGPSRYSQYLILLSSLGAIMSLTMAFSSIIKKFLNPLQNKLPKIKKTYLNLSLIIIFISSFIFFNNEKFDDFNETNKDLVSWLSSNTEINDVIFIPHEDNKGFNSSYLSFEIRIFAERAIWVDMAFPFNHNYINEWSKKYNLYKDFYKYENDKVIFCSKHSNEIDYMITKANRNYIDPDNALFSSQFWNVFSYQVLRDQLCVKH